MTTSELPWVGTLAAAGQQGAAAEPVITQVVFIDSRVPDIADLIAGAQPGEKVFILDPGSDGLDQIASDLASSGLSNLSAISIVGHGASGQMLLGSTLVDEADLASHADALAAIGAALTPGGDLSLYGCDVAEGAAGGAFIADLSAYAGGVDVAAATHLVGSADQGGSFVLDASTGAPVTASAFTQTAMAQYEGELGTSPSGASLPGDPDVFVLTRESATGAQSPIYYLQSVNDTGTDPQSTSATYVDASNSSTPSPDPSFVRVDAQAGDYFLVTSAETVNDGYTNTILEGSLSSLNSGATTPPSPTSIYSATTASPPGNFSSQLSDIELDPADSDVVFSVNNTLNIVSYAGGAVKTIVTDASHSDDPIEVFALDNLHHNAYFFQGDATYTTVTKTHGTKVSHGTSLPSSKLTQKYIDHSYLSEVSGYNGSSPALTSLAFTSLPLDVTVGSVAVDAAGQNLYFTVSGDASYDGVYKYALTAANTTVGTMGSGTYTKIASLSANGTFSSLTIVGTQYFVTATFKSLSGSGAVLPTSGVYVGNLDGSGFVQLYSTPDGTTGRPAAPLDLAVDQAPTLSAALNTPTYTVGTSMPVTPIAGASASDPDGNNTYPNGTSQPPVGDLRGATVVISANYQTGDTLNFTPQNGISIVSNNAGTLTLSGYATYAQYGAALASVTFSSTSENSATRSITYSVSDGLVSSGSVSANVMVVVPPPVVGGGGTTVPYTEAGTAATVDSLVIVQDPAGANITGATVTIASGFFAGDVLNFVNQGGITGSYNTGTGVLTLTGSASAATYQTALRSVTFTNSGQNPDDYGTDTGRTITFQVKDAAASSGTATSTVTINAADTPPVITVGTGTGAFTEKGAAVFVSPNATVTDVDNLNFNGGSLTVALTANGTSADQLTIKNQGTSAGQIGVSGSTLTYGGMTIGTVSGGGTDASPLLVSFTSTAATPTATTALLDDIQFSNNSNVPSTAARTVTYTVNDGGSTANGGNPNGMAMATVTVTAIDDPPSFSGLTTGPLMVFTGGTVVLESTGTIADPELDAADDYAGATLTFVRDGGANANDVFGASGSLSLAGGNVTVGATTVGSDTNTGGTLAITFDANATTALVSSVFDQINYANTGTTAGMPQIDFTIDDGNTGAQGTGGAQSATGNVVVDVMTDMPPVISGTSATAQNVDDNATISPFTGVTITDADTASQTVTVTLSHPTYGSLSNLGGGTYDAMTGVYTVSDTNANVTRDVEGLLFTPTNNQIAPGTTESEGFAIASNDGAITTTDSNTNVTITSVNDPPTITGTSSTAQMVDDNATIDPFTGVTIGDVDMPAQTQTVTVTLSAPADGTLSTASGFASQGSGVYTFSGSAMAATTALDALVFSPTNNQIAPGTTESEGFTIATNDGIAPTVSDSNTNVTITSVNDPPMIGGTVAGQTITDKQTATPFSTATISDPDFGASETVTITVTAGGMASDADGTFAAVAGLTTIGTGTYSLTAGSPMDVQAALRALVFTPTANQVAPGSTVTTGFTLSVSDGIAPTPATDSTTSLVVTSVNDPPTITGTSSTAQMVDDNATIDPFASVTIGDVDNPPQTQTVTVTLSPAADGTLSTGVGGFSASATPGVYTFSGTAAAATTALDALVFTPTNNQIAPGTTESEGFTIATNDGIAPTVSDSNTNVTITSVNDPPMIGGTVAGQTITDKQTATPFSTATISDPDFGASETVTITVTAGGMASDADGTFAAVAGLTTIGTGTYSLTAGSPMDVQAALRTLVFTPTANQVAPGSTVTTGFTLSVSDGIAPTPTTDSTTSLVVTSVNDPPTITGTSATAQMVGDNTTIDPFAGVTIGDVDMPAQTQTISVTLNAPADGTLSTGVGEFSASATPGVYTFSGTAAAATTALDALVFSPTNNQIAPGTTESEGFTIATNDGIAPTVSDSNTNVTITSVNDPPMIGGTVAGQTITDKQTATPFSTATISDPDFGASETVTITVSAGGVASDADGTFGAATGLTQTETGTYTLTTTTGSPASVQSALQALVFTPTANQVAPGSTVTTGFTLSVSDGIAPTPATDSTTSLVVTSVNDPPVITGTSATAQMVGDNTTIDPFAGVTIGDVDMPAQTQTIGVTLNAPADGTLSTGVGGFSASATPGVYTFSGTAAAATTALDALVFTPTNNQIAPGTTESEGFTITTNDGLAPTVSDSNTNVTITSVNDPPMIGGTVAGQTITDKQTATPFSTATISDPDFGASETVTITVTAGGMASDADGTFAAVAGLTTIGTGTYSLTAGSPMDVQAALRALVFTPTANQVAPGSTATTGFTLSVSDGIAPTPATDSTTSLVVTSVNDPPVITGTSATAQMVGDNTTIDPFAGVTIGDVDMPAQTQTIGVTLNAPADGTLSTGVGGFSASATPGVYTFSGTAAAATTALDALVFTPTNNQIAPGTTESEGFTIATNDGLAPTVSDAKTNVTITSIDDAPTLSVSGTMSEARQGGVAIDAAASVSVADVDSPDLASATVTVSGNAMAGDVLGINGSQSGTFDNGAITYSFSGATLTLTGADTPAKYQAALAAVTFQDTGSDTTTMGAHPTRTLSWTVNDGMLPSVTAMTTLTIERPPVLVNETVDVTTAVGVTMSSTAAQGVLAAGQASDPDGDGLTVTSVDGLTGNVGMPVSSSQGSLTLNADGSFTYKPASLSMATDAFTYAVSDGQGGTTGGTLTFALVPTITSITSIPAGGADLGIGKTVTFEVAVTQAVTVTGMPRLVLSNGAVASYVSGSNSKMLTFAYTVASNASESTSDLKVDSLDFNAGTIKSAGGQTLTGSVGEDTGVTIDSIAPTAPTLALTRDTGSSSSDGITSNPAITYTLSASGDTLLYEADSATSYSTTAPVFATDGSQDGQHTVSVEEEDAAGNISPAASLTFTLDTQAPVVAINAPSPNSSVSIIDPTISGTVDVADAGSTVTLTSGQTVLGTAIVASDGTWSDHLTFGTDGTYTVTASDTDAAGNIGQGSDTFTINSTPNEDLFGAITHDVTSAGGQIYALYETILGRAPDPVGFEGWVADLNAGTPLTTIAQDFLGSLEYANDYGSSVASDSAFINQLYEDGLHRAAEPEGLQNWENALASGTTRAQVAVDIATSQESDNDLASTFQTGVFVPNATDSAIARLYYGIFDRAPDANGLSAWEAFAQQGAPLSQIAGDFLTSPEYQATMGTPSNAAFVSALYEGALGRADTDPGAQGWINNLNQGASRASVAIGIAESPEATLHLASAIESGFHIA